MRERRTQLANRRMIHTVVIDHHRHRQPVLFLACSLASFQNDGGGHLCRTLWSTISYSRVPTLRASPSPAVSVSKSTAVDSVATWVLRLSRDGHIVSSLGLCERKKERMSKLKLRDSDNRTKECISCKLGILSLATPTGYYYSRL
jgi:hypothetical protein